MDKMYKVFVPLIFMLLSPASAEPYQCADLRKVISTCSCEARVFKNVVMENQVVINCRNLNLSSVPALQGSSEHVIYEMTLAQNNIQVIPAAAFDGLKIQRLDLRKNRLTDFTINSFQGLESDLKELYLGAENGANVQPPIDSLINLNNLKTLHMEYFTFPGNGIDPGIVNRLTDLTSLTLKNNRLRFIESGSLPSALTFLTLDRQDLTSFPFGALNSLPRLQSFTITNTAITALYREYFKGNAYLTFLDLGYNKISTLSTGCFEGITNSLLTLSLQNNPLSSVNDLDEIKQLTALNSLQLSDITLTSLPPRATFLLNKENLTSLHLDGNELTTLDAGVFNLPNLEELHLARNQIGRLDDQVFTGVSFLKYLDLGHQTSGQSLTLPESLTALSSLQTLKLSKTPVSPASLWTRIKPLDSLKTLLLDGTLLTSFPDYAIRNLSQLQELNLDDNRLTELTQEMLAGPRSLQNLAMNRNMITTINHCVFYRFTLSPPISLQLTGNPLTCDCKLRWLLEAREEGNITLTGAETCGSPADKAGQYLFDLQPTDLTCTSGEPDKPCLELYITNPISYLQVTNVSTTSITLSWLTANVEGDFHIQVLHMDLEASDSSGVPSEKIDATDTSFKVVGLKSNTRYSVCVLAFFSSNITAPNPTCRTVKTLSSSTEEPPTAESTEIGIIIGTIAAALVLLAVIAAIVYFMCWRKRRSKDVPAQPHMFTPSELPSMSANSRQFTKPTEKPPPKVGRALDENIKVTVISDGWTEPISPRHSVGSYQFLDGKHSNPNPEVVPEDFSHYSNDMDSRPLPTAPDTSPTGYLNGVEASHTYNEVDDK